MDSGFLTEREASDWASGSNLDSGFLISALNRFFDSTYPKFSGQDLVRAELAHQLHVSKTAIVPEMFTKRITSNYMKLEDAKNYCIDRGMALLGEGNRGYRMIKRHSERMNTPPNTGFKNGIDPYQFFKSSYKQARGSCSDEVWVEYPRTDNVRWQSTRLRENRPESPELFPFPVANSLLIYKGDKPTRRFTDRIHTTDSVVGLTYVDKKAGVVCVRNTDGLLGMTDDCSPGGSDGLGPICYED